ncbi:MAG: hypothetical protein ACP5D7_00290 [Limnospira sp.]
MTAITYSEKNSAVESNSWLYSIAEEVDRFTGDDWLALCPDISEGELYRDWFLCYDAEVTGAWEAYDHLTDRQLISPNLEQIKTQIDAIEYGRQLSASNIA